MYYKQIIFLGSPVLWSMNNIVLITDPKIHLQIKYIGMKKYISALTMRNPENLM